MNKLLEKYLSYLYPITRKVKSRHNGIIELTRVNGKLLLDSKNANYSYGSLQKVLKFALHRIDISDVNNALILGLGGGSVIKTLREDFHFNGMVVAVDIDPSIIEIAEKEFGIGNNQNTKVICSDAGEYVRSTDEFFDLIIIDLFIDKVIPQQFLTDDFWHAIMKRSSSSGKIIFNTLCIPYTETAGIERILEGEGFDVKVYRKVVGSNNVVIALKINPAL